MKKFLLLFLLVVLSSCANADEPNESGYYITESTPSIVEDTPQLVQTLNISSSSVVDVLENAQLGDKSPVSRAMAAKMIAVIFGGRVDGIEREITFQDTDPTRWYDRYINVVYIEGIMSGYNNMFMPDQNLTIQQAQSLIDRLNPDNQIRMQISEEMAATPISFALWTELLVMVMEDMSANSSVGNIFGVEERIIIPLATQANNPALADFRMITDSGPMSHVGISMSEFLDKEIRVLARGEEILSVLSIQTATPTIRNAYVVTHQNNSLGIFVGGVERVFSYDLARLNVIFHSDELPTNFSGAIANVTIDNDEIIELEIFTESITGIIKKVDFSSIELDIGLFPTDSRMRVYDITTGTPRWRARRNLIVGTSIARHVIHEGTILASIITENAEIGNIRVAIGTTGFSGLMHNTVALSGTTEFTLVVGEERRIYNSGDIVNMDSYLFGQQRVFAYPNDPDGRIIIESISRNWPNSASPQYRGIIEVARTRGGLTIVNDIHIEEYLYAVVPSEMPSSYGVEASKVQAVTARSFAYNQFFANRFHAYGANVDDSVMSQVYNNIPENAISIEAVNATRGQCLVFNNRVISANFFSTSSGRTANSNEVWINSATNQFANVPPPYLVSVRQYLYADHGDLSIEENARRFFMNTDVVAYDSEFAWFRWNTEMTAQELSNSINNSLRARYNANPQLIQTLQSNGVYRSREIDTVGMVTDLEVVRRGEGGNIMELRIVGTEAQIVVTTEFNIRMLLRPPALNRQDGSVLNNLSLLPSSFFVMDIVYDTYGNLESVVFYGGGNGHGAGMSQNGAMGMINRGYTFYEILQHFYRGTEVRRMID